MTPTDTFESRMRERAEEHAGRQTRQGKTSLRSHNKYYAFLAGAAAARADLLGQLRSKETEMRFGRHYETEGLAKEIADWLEGR